ncbi:diacylglycerol/lipid kinase family protein [Sinomicrobium sp. M5D2P17]
MKKIHFIVNPVAGRGNNRLNRQLLLRYFPEDEYDTVVKYSYNKGHAIKLTQTSVDQGAIIIVACGGDGTVNEIASVLVNTNILLGIIPLGSGNGLASHLHLPRNVELALKVIKKQVSARIDVGSCNGKYFFSNTGLGFDAEVIKSYESYESRKLITYIKACAKVFFLTDSKRTLEIAIEGGAVYKNPYLIFVSNSNELGYHISLTPEASLDDGLLDVLIVPRMPGIRFIWFGILMVLKRHLKLKEVVNYQTGKIKLTRCDAGFFNLQMDGEYKTLGHRIITIELLQASLSVIKSN